MPYLRRPTPALRATLQAALLLIAALPVAAQEDPTKKLERVEITGSAIKRITSEGALPVQVITRADIDKAGVTTAAELMAKVAANVGGLTDGASINVGGSDQRGFNSANLRGIGTSSTLVLLNGRRMANFASPGDDAGVDLNNIPAAAIQRVEVLLDGASALYGTDAIGGVINFITRKDFQGVDLSVYAGGTQEGGAGKRTASIAAGLGDITRDRFNIFGVLDVQHTDSLNTNQRKFIDDLQIPERLPHLLSGRTMPANIRLSSDQRQHLYANDFKFNGKSEFKRTINFSAPNCDPPANLYLPDGVGGEDACTYNYMRDTELYPKAEKLGFLGRGVLQLTPEHQLYAELTLSRAKTSYIGSSTRARGATIDYRRVPGLVGTKLEQDFFVKNENGEDVRIDGDPELSLQMRVSEAGRRTSEITSSGQRYVLGLTGILSGWDYDLALNHSVNTVDDRNTHGYLLAQPLLNGISSGLINPFGPSSAAGQALIASIQVNGLMRQASGTMDSLDFKASRALMPMNGSDLMLAVGGEFRREKASFTPSDLLLSNTVNEDSAPPEENVRATSDSRKVVAIYAEFLVPLSKQLEAQVSVRHDHYQGVGGATSPKLGLRYTPIKELLLRASAGAGFRAPSMSDLYRPTIFSSTATLPDPVDCARPGNDLSTCAQEFSTRRYSNPNLKPEHSRQFSFGAMFEPSRHWTLGVDYWNIERTDLISEIGDDIILGNLAKYGDLVHRDADGLIDYIELHKENRGAQKASGLDFSLDARGLKTSMGEFGAHLTGTLVLDSKLQTGPGDAYVSNLGKFVTRGVVQRWRHRITLDWEQGPLSLALSNSFSAGYDDQNSAIDTYSGTVVANNRVKAYSLWDLSGSYAVNKALTLRAGVQNLFNTAPPFSNQAYYFISGYDPSYTDPRGRFAYISAKYSFK